jgi:hypothetical protein
VKTLLKLAIAALILNATWRIGSEYLKDYELRDATHEAAMIEGQSEEQLRQRVVELAQKYDAPVSDADVDITVDQRHVFVTLAYQKRIQVVPGYEYPWNFSWTADAYVLPGHLK